MKFYHYLWVLVLSLASGLVYSVEREHDSHDDHGHAEHSDRVEISDKLLNQYAVQTARVAEKHIEKSFSFYGMIQTPQDRITTISAPYQSRVKRVFVTIGDRVKKGQGLVELVNIKNLQTYLIKSPTSGLVTDRWVNKGEMVRQNPLLKITDLSKVWVDFTVFPKQLPKLKKGQRLFVETLDGSFSAQTKLSYILPRLTGGHLAKARAVLSNKNNVWMAGMHVKAKVVLSRQHLPMAVKTSGLQNVDGRLVVFVKQHNHFNAVPIITGRTDEQYIEVVEGLSLGDEYVSQNSFLMKADVMKNSAAHGHSH